MENVLLDAIFKYSPDGFITYDEMGKITFVNHVIEVLSGFTKAEIVGEDLSKICVLPESILLDENSETKSIKSQAVILNKKDGKRSTFKARHIEIKPAKTKSYLIILHVEHSKENQTDRAQTDFISTVSHELRTPLTSIKGFADTLIRLKDKLSEENQKKYITIIKDQADRLTRLVEDLLAVSRLESPSFHLTIRALDLKKYLYKVSESLSVKWKTHKIIMDVEENIPSVWADADRLEQILTNLLDNAIKYSPGQDKIIVKLSAIKNNENIKDKLKIEVIDFGIGINELDIQKIFTRFGRLDNPLTRQAQGTGLGLFITKSLVLALKGEIVVDSKPGETKFTVILPAVITSEGIRL